MAASLGDCPPRTSSQLANATLFEKIENGGGAPLDDRLRHQLACDI
jgi:hypothetical protein